MTKVEELDILFEQEEDEEEQEGLTPEEEAEEKEGLAEAKAEELKTALAEKYGIDPDSEAELLTKLVEDAVAQRERLSKTIKQKISWRDKAKTSKPPKADGKSSVLDADAIAALIDSKVAERLEGEKLKSLDLPESLQSEVREIAKIRNITVGEAAKLPYILSRIEEVKKEERIKDATPGRYNNSSHKTSIDPSKPLNPSDFDLSSPEGRKAWNDAKAASAEYRKKHS